MDCVKRVAIVGGGPGGTACAKYLLAERHFSEIDIFEQQAYCGGVWNYTRSKVNNKIDIPQTNPRPPLEEPTWQDVVNENGTNPMSQKQATFVSPMYDRLETNIPHSLMAYSDDPSLADGQLFPSRESVLRYLRDFADDVKHLIRFQTRVIDVRQIGSSWQVKSHDLLSDQTSSNTYDAIVVASGHYAVPYIPDIKGIRSWNEAFPGLISHSKFYCRPEDFARKKTVVVGKSASGLDISDQLSLFCKPPLLVSQRSISSRSVGHEGNKVDMPEVVEFLSPTPGVPERSIRFSDGRVEKDIDSILFCTGYLHSYPFLSSLSLPLITSGFRVHHLFQHIFYIPSPTLAFVGVPSKILPFRTCEGQAAVIARTWSGRLSLPSEDEMHSWEETRIAKKGNGRKFHELLTPEDLDYHNAMVDWAKQAKPQFHGKLPKPWARADYWARQRFPSVKKAFAERGEGRKGVRKMEELGFDYARWETQQEDG